MLCCSRGAVPRATIALSARRAVAVRCMAKKARGGGGARPQSAPAPPALPDYLRETKDGALSLAIHVKPNAKRSEVSLHPSGVVHVAVEAVPRNGESNAAVIELVAKHLGVRRSQLSIMLGPKNRDKVLRLEDADAAQIIQKIEASKADGDD